jgi:ABC-type nitrate/sulfonate/bicarbonate transport system substrate-binding protein
MTLGSRPLGALLALLLCAASAAPARAEATEVRIARGFPISYLPFMVMEQEKLFMKLSQSKNVPEDLVVKILDDPDTQYTRTPMNVMKYADFMHRIGSIKEKPAAWQDLFFPEAHDLKGS